MGEAGRGPDAYFEPSGPVGVDGRIEERIRRSRFIACLAPCRDEAGCRGFLNDIHAAHRDATHNCWAYLLGPHPTTEYCSDDGEPSGTAGRPILGAVRRSGMVNVMVVVTRYFGGVKLGVRGLIEAYGLAAERVLAAAERVGRRQVDELANQGGLARARFTDNAQGFAGSQGKAHILEGDMPSGIGNGQIFCGNQMFHWASFNRSSM